MLPVRKTNEPRGEEKQHSRATRLVNCLARCLGGRTPAPSSRVQAKADVSLEKKMVPVTSSEPSALTVVR